MSVAFRAERRLSPPGVLILAAAAGAWLITLIVVGDMGAMPGPMGLGLTGFAGAWTLMMAAMMLPSVTPLASMYERSLLEGRGFRLAAFGGGHLLAWGAAGVPAFGLVVLAGDLARRDPGAASATAAATFAACGLYQLTPVKAICLARCRARRRSCCSTRPGGVGCGTCGWDSTTAPTAWPAAGHSWRS